jgi:HAD superfamily phosphatase
VSPGFFEAFTDQGIAWGFVSGAEPPSARYVLNQRLGLIAPPLIAMGDAPDKPDPTGLLLLAEALAGRSLGQEAPPIAYLGDTVADVMTVQRARQAQPQQRWHSLAVAPPHLHGAEHLEGRQTYEQGLLAAGADRLLSHTASLTPALLLDWLEEGPSLPLERQRLA